MITPTSTSLVSPKREHLLSVVEPTGTDDATLDLAHDVVARGGLASVLMLITNRVESDIRDFARSEDLDYGSAEARAVDQLVQYCSDRIGTDVTTHVARLGRSRLEIVQYLTDDVTVVAVPGRLAGIRKLAASIDRPLVVTPRHAA